MKTLKLGQEIKVGKYECEVLKHLRGYFLNISFLYDNEVIVSQFLPMQDLIKKFRLKDNGRFPYCDTLEQLTEVVEYLKYFEKQEFKRGDEILVWNQDDATKSNRIFFEYLDGNEYPFMCVSIHYESEFKNNTNFLTAMYKFAEPITKPKQITKDEIKKAFDCDKFEIID